MKTMATGLPELALITIFVVISGLLLKFLKQPLIIAYLLVGLLTSFTGLLSPSHRNSFHLMSDLGIMFLLFTVGLEINYTSLRFVGKISLLAGFGQIIISSLLGFLLAKSLAFATLPSLYISTALTFSSTIVVVKLLQEKKDLQSLTGKITTGILLIQDLVATILLIFLATIPSPNQLFLHQLFFTFAKSFLLFFLVFRLGKEFLPPLLNHLSHSQELLFLFSLAWALLLATLANWLGFPIGIGGFLAGLALSNCQENLQIFSRIRPLRDFFLVIFFVLLGTSVPLTDLQRLLWPVLTFSFFVLFSTPLLLTALFHLLGYQLKTGFVVGLNLAQVSEFSLILALLGLRLGHLDQTIATLITLIGIFTIIISSYLITFSEKIAHFLFPHSSCQPALQPPPSKPLILIGYHRLGQNIAPHLPKDQLLVIDFDPEMIAKLKAEDYTYLFGDISDEETRQLAHLTTAKLIISTSANFQDNLILLAELKNTAQPPKTIIRAETDQEGRLLTQHGATHILLPHLTTGQLLGQAIAAGQL
jgi:Kef-type K+ transport system membrane component KefB